MSSDHDNEIVMVVAGTHEQAISWAQGKGIAPHKLKIVDYPSQILGIGKIAECPPIWFVGTCDTRSDIKDIADAARSQGMEIRYAYNWRN